MDFASFLDQAWADHATQAAAVAQRLQSEGLALLKDEAHVGSLAFLAQHVHGQHLGRWDEGSAFQQGLAALPLVAAGSPTAQTLQRHIAMLKLAGSQAPLDPSLSASERTRLAAMTAAALGLHDGPRAAAMLQAAVAGAAALPDTDPAVRALAAAGNNLASTLEEEPCLDEAQRRLMLEAAMVSRAAWARAGTWLEVERADYRLAMSCLKAGSLDRARAHAQHCLSLVQAQPEPGAPALEHFFAWEAMSRVEHAAAQAQGHAQALHQAEAWFARLDEADTGWCRASLDGLRALTATG